MYPQTVEAISVVLEGYKNNLIQWMVSMPWYWHAGSDSYRHLTSDLITIINTTCVWNLTYV
jgi:hypothetical protein